MDSEISATYNILLVEFCGRIRERFAVAFEILKSGDYEWGFVIRHQAEVRDYIILHQAEITLLNEVVLKNQSRYAYPTLFAIYMCIIADLNECKNWNDALHQTDRNECRVIFPHMDEPLDTSSNCVCSHSCRARNTYGIINKLTGLVSIVGSDCIFKNGLIEAPVFARAKKETRMAVKQDKERKLELELRKREFDALKRRCPRCNAVIEFTEKRPYCKSEKRCNACLNRIYNKPFVSWKSN